MKIKAIDEQGYYNLNDMSITSGEIYETIEHAFAMKSNAVVVIGDDGSKVVMVRDEYEVVE